jgi:hypothetical protein
MAVIQDRDDEAKPSAPAESCNNRREKDTNLVMVSEIDFSDTQKKDKREVHCREGSFVVVWREESSSGSCVMVVAVRGRRKRG